MTSLINSFKSSMDFSTFLDRTVPILGYANCHYRFGALVLLLGAALLLQTRRPKDDQFGLLLKQT